MARPWAGLYGRATRNTGVSRWPGSRIADDILIDAIFGASQAGGATGALSVTLGSLSLASTGTLAVSGQLTTTLGAVTTTGTGQLQLAGAGSGQLGTLTLAAAGGLSVVGQLAATLGAMTLSASGTLAATGISGALAITLDPLTTAGTGQLPVTGAGGGQLGALAGAATGRLAITGTQAVTLDALTLSATATAGAPSHDGDAGTKGHALGGSLFRRKLVRPYATDAARKEARRKLPHIPASERDAISRAARALAAMPEFAEPTVDAVLEQMMPPGVEPVELHVHWLLYLLRVQAHRLAQEQDDEDVILMML